MNIANRLTVMRIILVPVMLMFLTITDGYNWAWLVAGCVFILAAVTDFVDGAVARGMKQESNFGKLMDPMADKLLVVCALLMLNRANLLSEYVTMVIVAREFVIAGVRQLALANGKRIVTASLLGKLKTVVQCVGVPFIMIGNSCVPGNCLWWKAWDIILVGQYIMFVSAILAVISGLAYIWANRKVLKFEGS